MFVSNEDDAWGHVEKRPITDEEAVLIEAESLLEPDWSNPMSTVTTFLWAIGDPVANIDALRELVAPYTRDAWGDFTKVKEAYDAIEEPGLASRANVAPGYPGVAYAKILPRVSEGFIVSKEQAVETAMIITLTYSESRERWLVYSTGLPTPANEVAPGDLLR